MQEPHSEKIATHTGPESCVIIRKGKDKALTGLRSGQTIVLQGSKISQVCPDPLRRISYFDAQTNRRFVFLTNNFIHFILPAVTIALLFKYRWQIEILFKWIKQHLRIKAFYDTSPNA